MPGLSDYWSKKILDYTTGKTSPPALANPWLALFTVAPTDAGGGTEVFGSGYARVNTAPANWNAASGSSPASTSNAQSISFAQATGSWGTVVAWGLFDAATVGNLLFWDWLGNFNWLPFSASNGSPSVLTSPAHGYSNGDSVVVTAEYGGTLPTGMSVSTTPATVAGASTDTFNIGINTTSTGNGSVRKVTQQPIAINVTPTFNTGALVLVAT